VIKGPKTKRARDPLEKNRGKTKKAAKKNGTDSHSNISPPKSHSSITDNIFTYLV
jgi:hypothetical protein